MLLRLNTLSVLAFALPLSLVAACDWSEVEQGQNGLLELVPSDCGRSYCDLDDGLATGGEVSIALRGRDATSAYGLTLISSAPWIAEVVAVEDDGFEPRFRVLGTGAGRVELIAIDDLGYEVDWLPLDVATIGDLEVSLVGDGATPLAVVGADSAFELTRGAEVVLDVLGTARGLDLTGEVAYIVTLDAAVASALGADSDLAHGHLVLRDLAPGDHGVTFIAPGGATERIRLVVR